MKHCPHQESVRVGLRGVELVSEMIGKLTLSENSIN